MDGDKLYRVGDEILFVDYEKNSIIGRAFLKSFENVSGTVYRLIVDRPISGVVTLSERAAADCTHIYNVNATTSGCVVRNSKLMYSRRYAWLCRSKNSVFENNVIYECAGSALSAGDEDFGRSAEGTYPSAFTMRNNDITEPKVISPDYPVQVLTSRSVMGSTASIENFLMENNVIHTNVTNRAIYINSVNGLYMLNNTLISDQPLETWTTPVVITNSKISMIDGLDFNYKQNVNAVITITGCDVDESNIKILISTTVILRSRML